MVRGRDLAVSSCVLGGGFVVLGGVVGSDLVLRGGCVRGLDVVGVDFRHVSRFMMILVEGDFVARRLVV